MVPEYEVAVIGAGPYGLSAASHLKAAGKEVRVFGEAMSFWNNQMPRGMFLRSSWSASHISDAAGDLNLNRYQEMIGKQIQRPIPLDDFISYGRWFAQKVVPDLDQRKVTSVDPDTDGFRLTLADGESMRVRRVVVATGVASFASRPAEFEGLPPELASHAYDHQDLGRFAGQKVMVVGAGQSALESAALLHEAGADVEITVRKEQLKWVRRRLYKRLGRFWWLAYAPSDVGGPGLSWLIHMPDLFTKLSFERQQRWAYRAIQPVGSEWLIPRLREVPATTGRHVIAATPVGDQLAIKLDDGSERVVDHVLLGTGYRVDVDRYDLLAPELLRSIERIAGYPKLARRFESSVPGLHFVGAPAAMSYGPLMRFVAGTPYTARALAKGISREAPSRARVATASA